LWVKRQAKKLLVILGFIGIALAADNLPVNNITADKVAIQFEQATEIKSKYTLKESVLTREAKSDPKDRIVVEIGDNTSVLKDGLLGGKTDATTTEFTPKLKISRWDEVSFSITPKDLDKIATKDKTLSFEGEKIKLETPKVDYFLYELTEGEGGFEYQINLKEKPLTNIIELEIESDGLEFAYQKPVSQLNDKRFASTTETQGFDKNGNLVFYMPENVVGSYVVYYRGITGFNFVESKDYKTKKAFHIYRPKIIDSAGNWIWGLLNIDNGILSVTIPQDFLDKAVYPIKHAAGLTFGYTSVGASSDSLADEYDDRVDGYTIYRKGNAKIFTYYYTTVGNATWTVPEGVTSASFSCLGGGGGGSINAGAGGNGGGGGAFASSSVSVSAGQNYIITVGAGGQGGQTVATNGATSSIKLSGSSTIVAASYGYGGDDGTGKAGDGGATTTSIGQILYKGGHGGGYYTGNDTSGGGGGGAGPHGAGGDGYGGGSSYGGAGGGGDGGTNGGAGTNTGTSTYGGRGGLGDVNDAASPGGGSGVAATSSYPYYWGGGGGGGGDDGDPGGAGGLYGAGSGGGEIANSLADGKQGKCEITITPAINTGYLLSISAYFNLTIGDGYVVPTADIKAFMNEENSDGVGSHGQIAQATELTDYVISTSTWLTFNANSEVIPSDWVLNIMADVRDTNTSNGSSTSLRIQCDVASSNSYDSSDMSDVYTSPSDPWISEGQNNSLIYSIYATYSTEPPTVEFGLPQIIIIE
jgi:hypothetical protein